MSIIKANTFQDRGGNTILSSDGSGTITLSSSFPNNTPAFHVSQASNNSIGNNSFTKIQWDTELYDSDDDFDITTNYRFTPSVAGKYFLYVQGILDINGDSRKQLAIYKNGSIVANTSYLHEYNVTYGTSQQAIVVQTTQIANGSSDYFEAFIFQNSGISRTLVGDSTKTFFGGYRVIGA